MYWPLGVVEVQAFWNLFENLFVKIVDKFVPMKEFIDDVAHDSKYPKDVKKWINVRNRAAVLILPIHKLMLWSIC